jgi:hypothetical protein
MNYIIQDREAGNIIEECETFEQAEEKIKEYERIDRKDGTYTQDFYEVVEVEE